jgi:CheY-like chemotaxis protein
MPDCIVHTVAVFNASEDTIEMLQLMLSSRGYRTLGGHVDDVKSGELDFIDFLTTHRPAAIIWDIAPPYDRNWTFFKLIRLLSPLEHCALVLTTTHKQHLDALVGHDSGAIEIVGKPYDLQLIVDAVARALDLKHRGGPGLIAHTREGS